MSRLAVFFKALVAALLLAVCLPLQAAPQPAAHPGGGSSIILGTQLEPTQLDVTAGSAVATAAVLFPAVYEGLVHIRSDGGVEPLLATSWEISADGRVYTFHLRHGVRFHDGTPFDATVVKFTLERAAGPGSINASRLQLSRILRVVVLDAYTAAVHLRGPYSGLLQLLGGYAASQVAPGSAATNGRLPVGTGPFRFVSWRHGEAIDLAANPGYWGARPFLTHATYRFIGDPSAALAALKAGDIDAYDAYPAPENVAELEADPRFRVHLSSGSYKALLALNNARAPLNNLRVRRALSHAIDRKAIIDGAMAGLASAIGSHYAPGDPGYVDLTGRYPHDPARARALLAEAGYPHGFDITLKLPPQSYARRSGEIIASQLGEIGVRVRMVSLEWTTWLAEVYGRHDYDMTVVMHVEPMDYDIYGRDDYYYGYASPAFKALLQQLDAASPGAARIAALQAIQRQIADDAVNVFLFTPQIPSVATAQVRDLWLRTPVQMVNLAAARIEGGGPGAPAAASPAGSRAAGVVLAGLLLALAAAALLRAGPAYLAGRLLTLAGSALAASVLIFAALQLVPGDPARARLDLNATPQAVAALRHQLGLDAPAPLRYLRWLGGVLHGDFGTSYAYGEPVAALLGERLQVSVPLGCYALLLSCTLALLIGIGTALHHGRWIDGVLSGAAQITNAIPEFWLGLMLVLLFGETLHWVSAGGFPGWGAGIGPALRALTVPAVALALPQGAVLGRILRTELIGALGEDYLRTARAKGLSERQALLRHGLPNVVVPALTILALQASFLVAGSVIVENVFSLPGVGRLLVQAVAQRDLIVVEAVVLLLVVAVVTLNMLVDFACAALDPRFSAGKPA